MSGRLKKSRILLPFVILMLTLSLPTLENITISGDDVSSFSQSNPRVQLIENDLSYTPHGPIVIDGDVNFTLTASLEGWQGDGSAETPYVIDGLDIDSEGQVGHCISISNTLLSFRISNCNLTGASLISGSGIYLNNATNGEIIDNTCTGNSVGIFLYWSSSNTVINNTCSSNNNDGIHLEYSGGNTVNNNTCSSNEIGIYFSIAFSNTVIFNDCASNNYGIYIVNSGSNTLANNTCTSIYYCIFIESGTGNLIEWNVFINSEHVAYDWAAGNVFDYNYWSGFAGAPDNNNDGICDWPYDIYDYGGYPTNADPHPLKYRPFPFRWIDSLPEDQTVEFGVYYNLQYDLNVIGDGPLVWTVSNTTLFSIDNLGVLESLPLVMPLGLHRIRIVVTNIYGLSASTSFILRVGMGVATPPGWQTIPTDQWLSYDEELDYQIAVLDPSGIDYWELNDTTHFSIEAIYYSGGSTARITNSSVLEAGLYSLNVSVCDLFGNRLTTSFSIIVEPPELDTTPPIWTTLSIDLTIEYGLPVQVQLGAWDTSGIDHFWLNDTGHFTLDEEGVIRNATVLDTGVYRLEVRAYDPYDNYCSATLILTVLEDTTITTTVTISTTTQTTTTTSTTSTTTTTTTSTPTTLSTSTTTATLTTGPTTITTSPTSPPVQGADPFVTMVIGMGIGGIVVVVIVIIILKKKT